MDGRREATSLSEHVLSRFDDPAGIVRFAGGARPSEFGALAPLVTEFAGRGDSLARDVMQAGADEIVRALPPMGWVPGLAICLTGGVGPHFRDYLPDDMKACLSAAEGEPLEGAISLARDLAGEAGQ